MSTPSRPGRATLRLLASVLLFPLLAQARIERDLSGSGWKVWLDQSADYAKDTLHLPPVALKTLRENPPSGGWATLAKAPGALEAKVPGTAEEYFQKTPGPAGDIKGVSWWWRQLQVPAYTGTQRVLLRFESARQRAEVFINQQLVGYDMIGNTPFEVDITQLATSGATLELAVRITDAGGNFDWKDGSSYEWGPQRVLMSHGFGGITGKVQLLVLDPVHIADLAVLNTPALTEARVQVELRNTTPTPVVRDLVLSIRESAAPTENAPEIARVERRGVTLAPNASTLLEVPVSAPGAKLWDLDTPTLHICEASLRAPADKQPASKTTAVDSSTPAASPALDTATRRFGFRWFSPDDIGGKATLRLNGKRIVLRTAISWGFWPINGIYPSAEWAEREVRVAKRLGLNMLNFHRCIGHPSILDKADELGLLFYEEPGNWKGGDGGGMPRAMAHEKLLRMVRRDRSHPSLVIYNLINEDGTASPSELADREADLRAAHRLDPSRVITRTSGWAKPGIKVEDPVKMHMRPWDDRVHLSGWYDFHHAGGPATWTQDFYTSPYQHYNYTDNAAEVVFWGEEGAVSTPPRLGLVREELLRSPHLGWDGAAYLDFHRRFEDFLDRKGLRKSFPDADALAKAMGDVSMEHQGRKLQLIRLSDIADGYAINGWEAELVENHSGVVDAFRNPKGDPDLIARYNRPLYVAVMPRAQIGHTGETITTDLHLVNEGLLKGDYRLDYEVLDSSGASLLTGSRAVTIEGGDRYGQPLLTELALPLGDKPGYTRIQARLFDAAGKRCAEGEDRVLAVAWKGTRLAGKGALFGTDPKLETFLQRDLGADLPAYSDQLGHLDWIVVTRPPAADQVSPVPAENLRHKGAPGLKTSFYGDRDFKKFVSSRTDEGVDLTVADGATPDAGFPGTKDYHVRWEGELLPTLAGTYSFALASSGGVRLVVNGVVLIDELASRRRNLADRVTLALPAGAPVPILVEYSHQKGEGRCRLHWAPPAPNPPDIDRLLRRVRDEGTRLVIVNFAEDWMDALSKYSKFEYKGFLRVGSSWLGGQHFVRSHPLVEGLPADCALGWAWQALVRNGGERKGLLLQGEELVVGNWHCNEEKVPMGLGTALGVLPCGKGRVILNTLDLTGPLGRNDGPSQVARRLLINLINTH